MKTVRSLAACSLTTLYTKISTTKLQFYKPLIMIVGTQPTDCKIVCNGTIACHFYLVWSLAFGEDRLLSNGFLLSFSEHHFS